MNTQQLLQHCLLAASLAGAAVCLAALFAYHFRNQLRKLHERWLGLGPLGRFATLGLVTVFVVYGSTKSPTNDPPIDIEGDESAPTNSPPEIVEGDPAPTNAPPPLLLSACCPPTSSSLTTDNQQLTTLPAWHRRGAYSDWQRIDFPPSFSFPHGTNLLTSITLFARGEIREEVKVRGEGEQRNIQVSFEEEESDHHCSPSPSTFTLNLPTAVSLEPNVSSCAYGLTPSNSFLIAWQNACVDRSATNRIDASIELFASGAIAITTQRPDQAPSTNYQAPTPPPGFFGSDQDNAWALAAFPGDYDAITNKGYEAWLMEDKVGINEQNGLYKASITIAQQPTTNNQQPIYLVCGPYKVVVTSSGTYSFPLEVFEHYTARTYPVALPLTISTDDGYRGNSPSALLSSACCPPVPTSNAQLPTPRFLSGSSAQPASRPRLALSAPPDVPPEYDIYEEPRLVLSPSQIPLSGAAGTVISIWCNIAEGARRLYSSLSGLTTVSFTSPTEAEIEESIVEDSVEFILETSKGSCVGYVYIGGGWWPENHPYHWCCWSCCGYDCSCDGTCCDCTCGCHD